MIITIDGPAASGKSTTARLTANRLGWIYLDTGAMYRSVAYKVLKEGISLTDTAAIGAVAAKANIQLYPGETSVKVVLDGEDVTDKIRTSQIDKAVGPVCEVDEVRTVLVEHQRRIALQGNVIAEGRDMGTVVFPAADLKFFMEATADARAKRRCNELSAKNIECSLDEIKSDIIARDKRDIERSNSPLKRADDARLLDTTKMSISQQVQFVIDRINERYED